MRSKKRDSAHLCSTHVPVFVSHAVVSGTYPWMTAYLLHGLDQKALSWLAEYDDVIISPFSALPRPHQP